MRNPNTAPRVQPIIVAEPDQGAVTRLFVIWDSWDELSQVERSEVITEAWLQVTPPPEGLKLAVAMGRTELA